MAFLASFAEKFRHVHSESLRHADMASLKAA
jgi:hypothetical protein